MKKTSATIEFHEENNDEGAGCMWGMPNILDYHHWLNIRNVFPLKRHHYPATLATYKRISILHSHWGDQQIGDEEAEPLLVRQHEQKCSAKGKSASNIRNRRTQSEHMETKKLNRDTPINSKRHSDSLEVLGVEKDLMLKFLHDLNVGGENFQLQMAFNNKASLEKSGSVPQTSQMRSTTSPTTLEHKQTEIRPCHKKNKLLHSTQAQKTFASVKKKQRFSSSSSNPPGLNLRGWNQLVLYSFKVIKQKIKHALMEFKKSGYQTSAEGIHQHNENEISDESKDFCYDSIRREFHSCRRRESSLHECLDRYTQLFEKSFGKDIKCHGSTSRSLKLPNEDKNNSTNLCRYPPKASRRNLSLPNLDSFSFLILHEALSDANDVNAVPLSDKTIERNNGEIPFGVSNRPHQDDISLDTHEPALEDGSFPQEQEQVQIIMAKEAIVTLETSDIEGRELNATAEGTGIKSDDEEIDSNFKHVKHVLEYLGLMGNEDNIVQLWHTLDQQLIDTSWFHVIESIGEDSVISNHHHHHHHHHDLLVSNIVKEVLLQIHETSSTYSTIIHKGQHLLNEVWIRVNSYLRLRPELDQTLDDVVGRDLAKKNGCWMILKHEEECVALELEEIIFKDLVDEIIFI
ncbi:hypothetical protein PIB30_030175 [Stylosanthes scabra]|uniref:DUF4378 domain-containing protein n=1 Tax=Stylosanthes scabra TaxID=79078 RepID=A0ABU6SB39_9FABA|nr:hypothetical protein [Stylosanthes scabra]